MSRHLKRLVAPRSWPIQRKTYVWAVKSRPGPHPIERSLPLLMIIRDILHYADTSVEAKRIISSGNVLVDGKIVKDYKRPVGLMDVLSIPKTKECFRVMLDRRGKIRFVTIPEKNAKWKLVRIENKTTLKGGKNQINLHDGRNILTDEKYSTGDTLKIECPSQKILENYPLVKGNKALIMSGKHAGEAATITNCEVTRSQKPNIVYFENFSTTREHVFVIGEKKSEVVLPEVSVI
ncbi:MAG: 30S ribosomal protein S4e [Candidatus Thermoplasmatota archaeon]|nr:30S ribosomal protein S4e [archaeon]MBU3902259.1 30S ribosomal protein S4e [Candidatus Thermoplasmatota archaeon]MBU4189583.1 30S ribosomal protein S4e [Candidatus Thermoplasmatota archaeon]MCG2825925.1 30S ribosomal protein S4e [Thermoplasmatales archaeon]